MCSVEEIDLKYKDVWPEWAVRKTYGSGEPVDDYWASTKMFDTVVEINDDPAMTEEAREHALITLFASNGIELIIED